MPDLYLNPKEMAIPVSNCKVGAMSHILVLNTVRGGTCLTEDCISFIEPVLQFHCREESWQPRWLAQGEAWEAGFTFDGREACSAGLSADLAEAFHDIPVDINIIPDPAPARRKKLLIADMDSTIINQECIDEIADLAGAGARVAEITERAMQGDMDFGAALRERVALLKGLDQSRLQQVFDERITLMSGARTLVRTMQANGAFCALVSGGFTFFTSRIAEQVGFNVNQANELLVQNGKLTGEPDEPILGRQAKLDALVRYTREDNLGPGDTLAVGDGANDLAMIRAAGLGVAYRAKPIVAQEAAASITHGDLTALLYLQGYTSDEFVR